MKRKIALAAFLLVILAISVIILIKNSKQNRVCFNPSPAHAGRAGGYCFKVELAKTEAERSRGLMFRKNLGSNEGMFFVYEKEGVYPFWMENTLIPLDIIWINQNKEVVFLSENSQPCQNNDFCLSIGPYKNAQYVLEVNGGTAEKIGLKIGDKMEF